MQQRLSDGQGEDSFAVSERALDAATVPVVATRNARVHTRAHTHTH